MFKKKKDKIETLATFDLADQISPMEIREGTEKIQKKDLDYLRIGEVYETTVMAVDLPPEQPCGWLAELYDMAGNDSVNLHVVPTGTGLALDKLNKTIKKDQRNLNDPKIEASDTLRLKKNIKKMTKAIENLLDSSARGFFRIGLTVKLQAYTLQELSLLKSRVENKLLGAGITPFVPVGSLMDGFVTALPYGENRLERYTNREMDSESLASFYHFDSQNFGVKDGFVLGVNPNNKETKINIDLDSLPNKNIVIFGDSGQGKSVTLWELICRVYKKSDDVRVIIIDPENEYGRSVRKMGGTTITISNGTKDVINPLQVFYENTENAADEEGGLEELAEELEERDVFSIHLQNKQEFFRILAPNCDETTMSYVDDCLSEVYNNFNIDENTNFENLSPEDYPILKDLYEVVEKRLADPAGRFEILRNFQVILKQYVYGINKKIFNGYTNVNLDSDLICFNIKDLGENTPMQIAAMSNLVQYIWDLITNNVKETYFFIDEMHVLNNPNSPQSAALLRSIYKRIRKYGQSGAISATQQPADTLSIEINGVNYGTAVFDNSTIQILLPMKPKSLQLLKEEASMQFTDEEVKILTIMEHKVGEGLLLYANKKTPVKFELTPYEWELLGKQPKNHKKAG
ncbi:VirB4 family type IV secretion system protein [Enterococcus sp. BWR-S5]|uniref:VirB4 family type IV secretion system protein n=1 Tax=Enterococcus sp. BWR-S5 TaxID=2787714 RepID=UPI0019222C76|nr:DUF87 domain-containing protein [Enterococcus sp. BWR-S5]MBL1227212.1 DUF87 domain-containing protein [Enterococcus sp. BWR-S5]